MSHAGVKLERIFENRITLRLLGGGGRRGEVDKGDHVTDIYAPARRGRIALRISAGKNDGSD